MSGLGLLTDDDEMVEDAVGPGSVGAGTRGTTSAFASGNHGPDAVAATSTSSRRDAAAQQPLPRNANRQGSQPISPGLTHPPITSAELRSTLSSSQSSLPLLTRPRSLTFFFAFLAASPHGARWWAALAVAAPLPDLGR